jgi:signal peptidase I
MKSNKSIGIQLNNKISIDRILTKHRDSVHSKRVRFLIWFFVIVFSVLSTLFLHYFIGLYKVPSSSMESTLIQGDYILVRKINYNIHNRDLFKSSSEHRIGKTKKNTSNLVARNDIVVFNLSSRSSIKNSYSASIVGYFVKRCYGLPGDTVFLGGEERKSNHPTKRTSLIKNEPFDKSSQYTGANPILFPGDSSLHWTNKNFGPLLVPSKNNSIEVSPSTIKFYRDVFLYENQDAKVNDTTFFINDSLIKSYTFRYNYFFMLGDNFYNSIDSRYYGFIPEECIVGKVLFVLISLDPDNHGLKKFFWNRLFKRVE